VLHWDQRTHVYRSRAPLRRTNERRLRALAEAGELEVQSRFVCECGAFDCDRCMLMSGNELRRALAPPGGSVVVPGHHRAGERVVLWRRHYAIVVSGPRLVDLSRAPSKTALRRR
jgi:hypothetical protein